MRSTLKQILRTLSLSELFSGLGVTGHEFFQQKITIRYPEQKTPFSYRHKGMLALRRYPSSQPGKLGEDRCIACKLCDRFVLAVAENLFVLVFVPVVSCNFSKIPL